MVFQKNDMKCGQRTFYCSFDDWNMRTRSNNTFTLEPVRCRKNAQWHVELLPRQPYETRYVPQRGRIGFAFETQRGNHAFASDRAVPFTTRANSLAYVPAGCEVMSRSPMGGEYLIISGPSLPDHAQRLNGAVSLHAVESAHQVRACLLSPEVDELMLEEAVEGLVGATCSLIPTKKMSCSPGQWMTPHRLNLVEDYIENHFSGPISVVELAEMLGLSTGFFIRAFKAALGRSPHGYIIDRRLAHARRLLIEGKLPIAQIALNCGFSSQAHMNSVFRKRLGITPLQLLPCDYIKINSPKSAS